MLNLTRCLGLVSAMPLAAACSFLAFTGCAGGGAAPVATSQAASLPFPSLPTRESGSGAPTKIYVVNAGNNTLTTYKYDGTPTTPTITDSITDPQGLAVDRNEIYVANYGRSSNGSIIAVAVDTSGKIYVGHQNLVETYNPDGLPTNPTIVLDPNYHRTIAGVAVDANGKIYVTSWRTHRTHCVYSCSHFLYSAKLTTYNPDGSKATPTIALMRKQEPITLSEA